MDSTRHRYIVFVVSTSMSILRKELAISGFNFRTSTKSNYEQETRKLFEKSIHVVFILLVYLRNLDMGFLYRVWIFNPKARCHAIEELEGFEV